MAWIAGLITLAAMAAKKIAEKKAADKRAKNAKSTGVGTYELQNQMREDQRLSKLDVASSLLGNSANPAAPAAAYGGRVNPNTGLDPALLAKLGVRRKYDFSKAVGDPGAGNGWDLGAGLAGAVGSAASSYYGQQQGGLAQGLGGAKSGVATGGAGSGLSFEELMKLRGGE